MITLLTIERSGVRLAPKPTAGTLFKLRASMYLFIVLTLLSASYNKVWSQQAFTLEEAMTYAEQQAPAVKLALADLAIAEGQIRETTALGIPKVNGSVDYTHFTEIPGQVVPAEFFGGAPGSFQLVQFGLKNSFSAGLRANTLLFDATFFVALRGAKLFRTLAVRTLDQTAYQTHVQVSRAYLAVLIAQRNLETLERNVTNLERTLFETNAIYEEGLAEKLSVDRLRLTLGNLQAQRETLLQVQQISKNLLKFQMGYPVNREIELTTDLDEALGDAQVTALVSDEDFNVSSRPELATLQVADSLNAVDLQRIRAGYFPSLTGFGQISRTLQRNNLFDSDAAPYIPGSSVGVSLNIPIYDGGTKKAQRQQALARVDQGRIQIEQFSQSARLALANARASVSNARLAVRLREGAIELAEEIYDVAQIKFREGVGSSLEVNQAQADLYAAQDALTQALYDLAVAYTDYQDATGTL